MALDNYANLKESIISWSHRNDLDLLIDDFILIAETEMLSNSISVLRVREVESKSIVAASTAVSTIPLPVDYQSMRSIRIDHDEYGTLRYRTPEALGRRDGTGQPLFFTITTQIEFDILPDKAYSIEINYAASQAALTAAAPTNSILTNYANIYLFGALWALFTHADDEAQAQKYYSRFIGAIQGANKEDKKGRYGPNATMAIDGPTP